MYPRGARCSYWICNPSAQAVTMRRMSLALVPLALLAALASPPTASARVGNPETPVPTIAHAEYYATAPATLAPVISITTEVRTAYAVPEVGMMPTYVNKASPMITITDFAATDLGNEIGTPHRYMTSTTSNDLAGRLGNMQGRRRPHLAEPTVDSNLA